MIKSFFKALGLVLLTLFIPAMLLLDNFQSSRFSSLSKEVRDLEKRQYELIDSNKRLIAGISMLSSPERIELIARDTLHMRKARPDEILRIEIKGKDFGFRD